MINYTNGKMYKIVCNITGEVYIGSTTKKTLAQRLVGHVCAYNRVKKGILKSTTRSFDIIDRGNYNIYLIELFPCNSKDELTAREGHIIQEYKLKGICINYRTEGRSKEEYSAMYRSNNREEIKERLRVYRQNNKEKIHDYKMQYQLDNCDRIKEESKNYREKNKLKLLEKITCECGSCILKNRRPRHERSKKHQNYITTVSK